jgi:SAM-dependent methyltransferase
MSVESDWLDSPNGRRLLQEESGQVKRALESIFGDYLVQIGAWGPQGLFLEHARTRHKVLLSWKQADSPDALVCADLLGLASDSVDAVLLPHVLEAVLDPIEILREVDRVLRPEGHMVVLGFSPASWWGLRHSISRNGYPPGLSRHISERRLSDWLRLLNFRISYTARYYPAAEAGQSLAGQQEPAVQKWWNWKAINPGYILVAYKELFTLTLVRPRRRHRTRLVGGLVNPTIGDTA